MYGIVQATLPAEHVQSGFLVHIFKLARKIVNVCTTESPIGDKVIDYFKEVEQWLKLKQNKS